MDNQIRMSGRVSSGPVQLDDDDEPVTAFVIEGVHSNSTSKARRSKRSMPWCDVICVGTLAQNVLISLVEGDHVFVEGELRVHRLHPRDDERDSVLLAIRADTVALDLNFGAATFAG